MARKTVSYASVDGKDAPPKEAKQRFNDVQFIQYELSKEEAAKCKEWALSLEQAFQGLLELCDRGYSVSLRFDDYSEAYSATIIQKRPQGPNKGYALPGRGSSPFKALKNALYKHFDIMGETWSLFAGRKPSEEIDD